MVSWRVPPYRPNWIESEWYPWDSDTNSESCVKNEEYHPQQQTKSSAWCAEHAATGKTDSQNQKKNSWKISQDSLEFGFMNWPRRLNGLLFFTSITRSAWRSPVSLFPSIVDFWFLIFILFRLLLRFSGQQDQRNNQYERKHTAYYARIPDYQSARWANLSEWSKKIEDAL